MTQSYSDVSITIDGQTWGGASISVSEKQRDVIKASSSGFSELSVTCEMAVDACRALLALLNEDPHREARRLARRAIYNNRTGRSALRRLRRLVSTDDFPGFIYEAYVLRAIRRQFAAGWS